MFGEKKIGALETICHVYGKNTYLLVIVNNFYEFFYIFPPIHTMLSSIDWKQSQVAFRIKSKSNRMISSEVKTF